MTIDAPPTLHDGSTMTHPVMAEADIDSAATAMRDRRM
jgi:hypothetical protein